MNTFYKTLLICLSIALLTILTALFTGGWSGLTLSGLILVLAFPVMFLIGLIVIAASNSDSEGRKIGQGIMLASLLYVLIGFATCSGQNF